MRFIFCLMIILLALPSFAANFPLEIIQPQAGLTTVNRFYKAYPGLVYNVRAGVVGGAYPYTYSLTAAPSGMTIDSATGEITWSNPTATGSPHSVTMSVTDSESTTATVSWTVTVTTTGFIFVDAADGHASTCNGGSATGTISDPFLGMADFYCGTSYASKSTTEFAGYFVYWRTGTYAPDGYADADNYLYFSSNRKPLVWLAYPGETPVIDYNDISNKRILFQGNSDDRLFIDGLTVTNTAYKGIQMGAAEEGAVFRNMTFSNLHSAVTDCSNQSFIMFERTAGGGRFTLQDSEFSDLIHGAAVKLYTSDKALIEDNYFHDISDVTSPVCASREGIAMKEQVTRTTVRHNRFYNAGDHAIGGNMNLYNGNITENIEILFNRLWGDSQITLNQNDNAGALYVYRNTLVDQIVIDEPTGGPFHIYNNAIQAESPQISGDTTNVVDTNNLKATSGIVDTSGLLVNRSYVGTYGWELAAPTPTGSLSSGVSAAGVTFR